MSGKFISFRSLLEPGTFLGFLAIILFVGLVGGSYPAFYLSNAIGKRIKFPGDTSGRYLEMVCVVKDFNQKSLYNPITLLIIYYRPSSGNIQIKLDPKDVPGAIANIEKSWKKIFPDLPFEYIFLDQDFDSQYAADQKRGKIFTVFSILTILITCLGLLGLIVFTTQQRQKEISIRKKMGAGVGEIVPLITTNFIVLVGISCLVAFPVAYLFMNVTPGLFENQRIGRSVVHYFQYIEE